MAPSWDIAAFRAIHHGWHHPVLDPAMKALTDVGPWKVPLLCLVAILILTRGRRGALALAMLAATLTASDQLSSHVLKPMFRRPRPCLELADTRPLFGARRSYSFPSTHATNFFAATPLLASILPQGTAAWVGIAGAVSISRIYVGDHYPSDVIAGALLGTLLGFLGRKALLRLERTMLRPRVAPTGAAPPSEEAPSGGP